MATVEKNEAGERTDKREFVEAVGRDESAWEEQMIKMAAYRMLFPNQIWPGLEIKGYHIPMGVVSMLDKFLLFPCRETDVWITSFPKSGTTWTEQIVYLIMTQDFKTAREVPVDCRVPQLCLPVPYPPSGDNLDIHSKQEDPRIWKTHMPARLLPFTAGSCKKIYIVRNPKDTMVSMYKMTQYFIGTQYEGSFTALVEKEMNMTEVPYGPWSKHAKEHWALRDDPTWYFLRYEELKKNPKAEISKIAKFLGKELSEEILDRIVHETSFAEMKNNPGANYSWCYDHDYPIYKKLPGNESFMRKGEIGTWKAEFTPELEKRFDEYVDRELAGTGLSFTYT